MHKLSNKSTNTILHNKYKHPPNRKHIQGKHVKAEYEISTKKTHL